MSPTAVLVALVTAGVVAGSTQKDSEEFFEDETRKVELEALLEFRFIRTDATTSWLDAGLGKARYGGDGSTGASLLRVPQASIVLDTHFIESPTARYFFPERWKSSGNS